MSGESWEPASFDKEEKKRNLEKKEILKSRSSITEGLGKPFNQRQEAAYAIAQVRRFRGHRHAHSLSYPC